MTKPLLIKVSGTFQMLIKSPIADTNEMTGFDVPESPW
jgi:hypothetical protein